MAFDMAARIQVHVDRLRPDERPEEDVPPGRILPPPVFPFQFIPWE
jgi:hypothetical protein